MIQKITVTILILLGYWQGSTAQDGHYWTQQYGTKSMLLSGSVIGGVEDLGAVYYNPGRLAVIANSAFLLSGSVYEYSSIQISDAFGAGKSTSKSEIKGVPTLAAGTFKIKKLPKHFFAYAILTRQHADLSFAFRDEVKKDVLITPGIETFGAEASYTNSANEQWIGLTWSYALSPKISVGVTTNFSTNSQSKGSGINLHALSEASEVGIYYYKRNYSYKETGLLWKAGLAAELGIWQLGLTVTTPMIKLSNTGNYSYEEFFSTIPGLLKPEQYSSSYQSGLKVNSSSPWSVGLGATRKFGRNKIHVSTEYYSSLPKFLVMQTADHISQSNPADTIRFQLQDELKGVWNAGAGAEIYISESVSGFASFSTDFSAVPEDISRFIQRSDQANNSSWKMNLYNVGGGIILKLKGADITLGATHTGGSQQIPRSFTFPENPGTPILTGTDVSEMQWDRWRFVFSFSLPFLKDYAKKFTDEKK